MFFFIKPMNSVFFMNFAVKYPKREGLHDMGLMQVR